MSNPIVAFDESDYARIKFRARQEDISSRALKEAYDSYFRVVPARTKNEREQAFRLRYQVYCLENAFESAADNPGGRETDEYDAQSMQSLLMHRSSRAAVGTVRLILPRQNGEGLALPIETLCPADLLERYADRIPRDRTAEISRFAVAKKFRRRVVAAPAFDAQAVNCQDSRSRHAVPNICLGLMRAIVAMTKESGMSHLFAVMEPTLLRLLRNLGIYFEPLGPIVDYHGRRQPCFCDLDHLLATAYSHRPDVWALLTDSGRIWPLYRWRQPSLAILALDRHRGPLRTGKRAFPSQSNSRLLDSIKGIS